MIFPFQVLVPVHDELIDRLLRLDRADDGAKRDQRITLEIHLGDQPLAEGGAEDREMDMRRAPAVVGIRPRIGARADGVTIDDVIERLAAPFR